MTEASVEAAKADLAQAVASAAREVAHNTSAKQKWQWACGCILGVAMTFSAAGWYIHSTARADGFNNGYGVGYNEAKDEKAAAAWANTPEGKMAYRFAQSGELRRLAKCDGGKNGPNWAVENNVCRPYPSSDGTSGWTMP